MKFIKKYGFYIALLLIFVLFLTKDYLLGSFNNKEDINNYICEVSSKDKELEYQELLNMLDIESNNYQITYARVINRNMYEFYEKLTINKGSTNNLKVGDLVVSDKGVLGVIGKAKYNRSEVTLLSNEDINLSVKINEAYGIISATNNKIIVKNIKLTENINIGDKIYTSGLTNIPPNYLIGEVKNITKDNLELEYIIDVDLSSDLKNIQFVGVISL